MATRVRMICTPGHDYYTGRHSTMQNGGQKTVQTFDRAVAILDAFTPKRPELGVSEIARITGLSRSTVHRLLATLHRHELVQQIPGSRNYALGPHLLRLAQIAFSNVNLQDVAKVVMTELRDKCDETVGLHTQLGPFTRTVLDQVESRQQLRRTYGEIRRADRGNLDRGGADLEPHGRGHRRPERDGTKQPRRAQTSPGCCGSSE
ncbi:MAG: helix-turn-helix domain-containing protein [Actinobacteria bacterium]|nr:helix-turn-helix domain-containing protein [Actinomycetota bacterium]